MLFEKTKGKTEDSMVPDMKEVTFWEEEPLAESICEAVSRVRVRVPAGHILLLPLTGCKPLRK